MLTEGFFWGGKKVHGGRLKAIQAAVVLSLSRKKYLALKKLRTKSGKFCVCKGVKYILEYLPAGCFPGDMLTS
jgi:hypothetical protein